MAPATVNLRLILKKSMAFVWTPACEAEFQQMKMILCNEKYIKPFDLELYIELLMYTSKVAGAEYILIQCSQDRTVHIVQGEQDLQG